MEEQIIHLAHGKAEQCDVLGVETDRTGIEFRANEMHSQETRLSHGWGLRVIKNGRAGFSASSHPGRLEQLVEAACETAALGKPARFDLPAVSKRPEVKTFENRVLMLSAMRLSEWATELIEAIRARVPDIKLDVSLTRVYRQLRLLNSAGLDVQYSTASLHLSVTGLLVLEGLFWLNDYENLSDGRYPSTGEIADRFETRARLARTRARLDSGSYPVIFAPQAVPNLLLPLQFAVSGKALEKGTSPLMGKVGQQLLDAKLSIIDNPLRPHAAASAPADGDGTPCRRLPLFERGVFRGFIFDLATAAACRQLTTGSAARDYAGPPQPDTTNIEVAPGGADLDSAVQSMESGLLVYDCIGGGQSNIMAGDVSLNISCGYKVEHGRIVGRVKDAMIAGNVFELLKNVAAVGDTQRDLADHFVPFIQLDGLTVAAR
jgi:PmbA protein